MKCRLSYDLGLFKMTSSESFYSWMADMPLAPKWRSNHRLMPLSLYRYSSYRSLRPNSGRSRGGGRNRRAACPPPPKLDPLCVFFIRMRKNKAQIAWESIKTTLEFQGPLCGPWTPAKSEFGSALIMCLQAHNLLCPPPPPQWKSWIRPCWN